MKWKYDFNNTNRTKFDALNAELTEETKNWLIEEKGFTKQMVESTTAKKLFETFTEDDQKVIMFETVNKVNQMLEIHEKAKDDFEAMMKEKEKKIIGLSEQIEKLERSMIALKESENQYGKITDERALNAIALYDTVIRINERCGCDGTKTLEGASYIVWAYLAGETENVVMPEMIKTENKESNAEKEVKMWGKYRCATEEEAKMRERHLGRI